MEEQASAQKEGLTQMEQFLNQEDDIPGGNLPDEQISNELHALLNSPEQELYALNDLPPGYRFAPKDHELINDYLKKKINNTLAPYSRICSVDVYKYSPQELTEKYLSLGDGEWYFFSPIERKNPLGNQPNRATGNGYWKRYYIKKQIHHNNILIGSKITLTYYEGSPPNVKKTNWGMIEYMIEPSRQQNDTTSMLRLYRRVANYGYWKYYGTRKQIYHNDVCIGFKKYLIFYEGEPPYGRETIWVMKEYTVDQSSSDTDIVLEDYVLCQIRMRTRRFPITKKRRDRSILFSKFHKTKKRKAYKLSKNKYQGGDHILVRNF